MSVAMRRQMLLYLPANIVPALLSVATVVVFTRLLTPRAFGLFNFGFSAVMFMQGAVFYAPQLAVTRLLPAALRDGTEADFLITSWTGFAALLAAVAAAAALLLSLLPMEHGLRTLLWLALPLLVLRAVLGQTQARARASNRVRSYVMVECLQSVCGFALGLACVMLVRPTGASIMLGLIGGAILAVPFSGLGALRQSRHGRLDPMLLRVLVAFVMPLAGAYVVSSLLQYADRFLVGTLAGASVLGVYAVAFSLVERPTTLLCTLVSTATFPMAVHAMEHEGIDAARRQSGHNGATLLALAIPACLGLALCAPSIAAVMVGPQFRPGVAAIIPLLALAALMRNVSTHCLDHAFHLLRRPDLLLLIYGPAAAANILLDVLLIPRLGMFGAAAASLVALGGAMLAGIVLGRRHFRLWLPMGEVARTCAAAMPMLVVLALLPAARTAAGLAGVVLSGTCAYAIAAAVLDVGGSHAMLRAWFSRTALQATR